MWEQMEVFTMLDQRARYKGFAFSIDETADASEVEQTAVVVRVLHEQLTLEEIFLADMLQLRRTYSRSWNWCKAVCFDSAWTSLRSVCQALDGAAMAGRMSDVKIRFKDKYPRELFVYCAGYTLNLVIRHAIDDIPAGKPAMTVVGRILGTLALKGMDWVSRGEEEQEGSRYAIGWGWVTRVCIVDRRF